MKGLEKPENRMLSRVLRPFQGIDSRNRLGISLPGGANYRKGRDLLLGGSITYHFPSENPNPTQPQFGLYRRE